MKTRLNRNLSHIILVGVLLALALVVLPAILWSPIRGASTDVGDLLQTVNVPEAAQCSSGIGTSVAIVPGSMVDLAQYPILLVTSCFSTSGAQISDLYFLDPSTDPATLVLTINTNPTPPMGWGALALRGDKGDLLGCGNASDGTHAVYSIDISPYTAK